MMAAFFQVPELALEKDEARAMAEALAEVNRHYKIPGLNPAHAAIISACFVIGGTYAKRIPAVMSRSRSRGATAGSTASHLNGSQNPQTNTPQQQSGQVASDWFTPGSSPPLN